MEGLNVPHPVASAPSPYVAGDLYDLILGGYREDLAFYVGRARAAEGPVLELACGTGRVLLPTLEAGVEIEGLDLQPQMIERLHRNAAQRSLEARAWVGDMRRFALDRRFALITITFNAFVHNLTTEDQLATLRACHEHLLPGGTLVFDVMSPSLELLDDPDGRPVLELDVAHPETGLPLRMYDTRRKDLAAQTQHSRIEIRETTPDGGSIAHHFETTVRWIFKPEMELLLQLAGFERWTITGDFVGGPFTSAESLMIVTAWRSA
jgi:SAM-dependent methyltransferase